MKRSHKKALVLLVKLAVAAGLLALVVAKVHWADYTETIRNAGGAERQVACRGFRSALAGADLPLLAAALVCFAIPVVILAVRWWYLLRVIEIRIRLWESVRLTFLGYFFNYIVPGVVSGDLVKAWYAFKHTDRRAAALVSIFVDRLLGLLEFAILPAVVIGALWAGGHWNERFRWPTILIAAVLAGLAVGFAVVASARLRHLFGRLLARGPLRRHLAVAGQAVEMYRRRLLCLVKALGITFGSQVIFIGGVMLAGRSLHLPIAWYEYFLYTPLVYIIAAVPVSPGGIGVMEWCFVTFFAVGATTASEATALALLARLGPMLCSLPGLVVALTGPKLPKAERIQAELAGDDPPPVPDQHAN